MSNYLATKFNDILFKNPVIPASGTFGFGREYEAFYDLSKLGGLCSKGLTLEPKSGNTGMRLWETPAGLMNSIGLENPGIDAFIENEWPHLKEIDTVTIVNVGGKDEESYLTAIEKLNAIDAQLIELNISCPNGPQGQVNVAASRGISRYFKRGPFEVKANVDLVGRQVKVQVCSTGQSRR